MNLVLLFDDDFLRPGLARLSGRRREHIASVHRVSVGDELVVGVANGRIGTGTVTAIGEEIELRVTLQSDPPPPLDLMLAIALPRPKVLGRVVASATSLGVKRLILFNAWRVEKSYWKSPRLSEENLRAQAILGLEQARDTVLPKIETRRFFRQFVEEELAAMGGPKIVAHPYAQGSLRSDAKVIVIGPEGGFIEEEIASLERAGCVLFSLGERILRVETAVATAIALLT